MIATATILCLLRMVVWSALAAPEMAEAAGHWGLWLGGYLAGLAGYLAFHAKLGGTPGKWAMPLVVDAETGRLPTPVQCAIRWGGYHISALPFGLGFLWAFWDPR